ncbi:MAG: putative alkyl dihydroxyacetonephosphate synthase agp [Myxococcales bacterium]|nr:putative alkyl dihydroxyacetonephosphate synthase agp [Myxococcales bacterium]
MLGTMDRQRSLWAWGWRDKFPDDAARAGLVQLARALVPTAQPASRSLPPDEPEVAPARVSVPDPLVTMSSQTSRDRAAHSRGRAFVDLVAGFAGDYGAPPDLIVRPRDPIGVARVLEVCDERGFAVVPFGGGTSVVGGVDAAAARGDHPAVVCLDLSALAGVLEVDTASRLARIGAGTFGPRIEDELATHGLTLRHFPQSFEFSTLGGWLATRAGGHFATGATHIDDLCHSLTMVAPSGTLATHRHPASGAGPEAARLLLGSEGAFGVITEAWMRVVPRPRWRASASVAFRQFEHGVAAARALVQSGLQPANARLLDPNEARLHRVRFDGSAVLLIGFESSDHPMTAWLTRALELARDHGGEVVAGPTEKTDAPEPAVPAGGHDEAPTEAATWRQAFFDAPYLQSALLSIGILSDTFETACTWAQYPELHAKVTAAMQRALDEECGGGIVSCRFTHLYPDGPAPYYTFVGALRIGGEVAQWRALKAAASEALVQAGGTITHHHAVGRTHKPWYERERPPLFGDALTAIKRTFDPRGIMNPGALI